MIEELRRFILVAQNGNLTRTAEQIFITQSALSQSIKRLEQALETKLFTHRGKQLHITTDGIAVREIGIQILSLWEKAQDETLRQTIKPTYIIGMFDNAALRLGAYLQKNMHHDAFHLELQISSTEKLLTRLRLGLLDIAICVLPAKREQREGLLLLDTFTEKLIPVASHQYHNALAEIPFLLYNKDSNTREQIDAVFTKAGIVPTVFAQSTSVTFMQELARLGCGVALLPENIITTDINQGLLQKQKLPLMWKRTYGIYIHKHGKLTKNHPIITELRESLKHT